MKELLKYNNEYFIIHRTVPKFQFNKGGRVDSELVKLCVEYFPFVDDVLQNDKRFLFVEKIQDAEIIEG